MAFGVKGKYNFFRFNDSFYQYLQITFSHPTSVVSTTSAFTMQPIQLKGKAPIIYSVSAEVPEMKFDDWLSFLERGPVWIG